MESKTVTKKDLLRAGVRANVVRAASAEDKEAFNGMLMSLKLKGWSGEYLLSWLEWLEKPETCTLGSASHRRQWLYENYLDAKAANTRPPIKRDGSPAYYKKPEPIPHPEEEPKTYIEKVRALMAKNLPRPLYEAVLRARQEREEQEKNPQPVPNRRSPLSGTAGRLFVDC